jgi:hypothetical protein
MIHWLISHSDYVMSYFHPRDFDPNQPLLKGLPVSRRLKSYTGLKGALLKLRKILDSFHFTDISGAVSLIEWKEKYPVESY